MNANAPNLVISVGDRFPQLTLRSSRDRECFLDPRSAVVVFYRGRWCGHCREQLTSLARDAGTFRAMNVTLAAISADDFVGANDMCLDTDGQIDIYSDPAANAIQQLGLADRDDKVDHIIARPSVFIIDSLSIVRYRYVGRSPADRPTSALLALAAESLSRTGTKEPVKS